MTLSSRLALLAENCRPTVPDVYPKSPLRYPGGKSRAVKFLYPLIPSHVDRIIAPFFGGGSLELALTTRMDVIGYDIFEPVVNFWQHLLTDQEQLVELVRSYHPITRDVFYNLQKHYEEIPTRLEKAAVYFVLNRASFSGTTFSGGMSPGAKRFTESSIQRLADFHAENLDVFYGDAFDVLESHDDFLYLDPPYEIDQALYGYKGDAHKGFNHYRLFQMLTDRPGWVMSYNDSTHMRELYKEHLILEVEWSYGMGKNKKSNEIVILSKDLS